MVNTEQKKNASCLERDQDVKMIWGILNNVKYEKKNGSRPTK